jgi:Mn2+/Fe2+ NRAMP family transporter
MSTAADTRDLAAAEAVAEPASGPAAALILAGGIATFCLGLVTTLAEASTGIADALQWNDRVGPLSGKTLITVSVFAVSWGLLTLFWRRQNPPLRTITIISAVLIVLGLIGTFPTFFQAFE